MGISLAGVFPPLVTTFAADGDLDLGAYAANLDRYAEVPLAGYVALGTTGEFPHLDRREREAVIAATVAGARGRPVIAQVGSASLRETADLARAAADLGAAAVLAVTPHYYKSQMSDQALLAFYTQLADRSPLPVLIYNIPQNTGVNVSPRAVAEAARHPNLVGMKDSGGNLAQLTDILDRTPSGWALFNGSAAIISAAAAAGVPGAILAVADAFPDAVTQLWQLCGAGQWAAAFALERRLRPLLRAISGTGVAGVKYAMDRLGWQGGSPRSPLLPLDAERQAQVTAALEQAGLLSA